jgi:hypothetical protein
MLVAVAGILTALPIDAQTNTTKKPAQQTSQASPSLAETLEFINQALASDGGVRKYVRGNDGWNDSESRHNMSLISRGSCMITFNFAWDATTTLANGRYSSGAVTYSYALNLADIDPSSVNSTPNEAGADQNASWAAWGYAVRMATRNLDKKIVRTTRGTATSNTTGQVTSQSQDSPEYPISNIEIDVSDGDIASRIAHALTHAVELCGGKKSAF